MSKSPSRSGITLVELLVAMAIIAIVIGLLVVAVQKVRSSAARAQCQNKLKQIALAVHGYDAAQRRVPVALNMSTVDNWYLSWMGRILPYLDQDPLAARIDPEFARVNSPWGIFWKPNWGATATTPPQPPHEGFSIMLDVFRCPIDSRPMVANLNLGNNNMADAAFTDYIGVSGTDGSTADGIFVVGPQVRLNNIPDGASNTLMIGERPPYDQWWYGMWYAGAGYDGRGTGDVVLGARDLAFAANLTCPPAKVGIQPGRAEVACDLAHFWSFHSGGSHFAFADGTVRFVSEASDNVLPALATRDGGEVVD